MNSNPPWEFFFVNLLHLPLFLVWIAGIITAVKNWKKHPKVSKLTLIALTYFLMMTSLNNLMGPFMVRYLPPFQLGTIYMVIRVVSIALNTIFWIFLIVAIFSERENPKQNVPQASRLL